MAHLRLYYHSFRATSRTRKDTCANAFLHIHDIIFLSSYRTGTLVFQPKPTLLHVEIFRIFSESASFNL